MYLCKFLILTVLFLAAVILQNLALAEIGVVYLPEGAFDAGVLVRFAEYSFVTSMPVLSFMVLAASRFENMWVPLGIGVAGFLSGMALANMDTVFVMLHPFVVMLKPAVAQNCLPDGTVIFAAFMETCVCLVAGLLAAQHLRYE